MKGFWETITIIFIINMCGVGIDIDVEYSIILLMLSMIGLEISKFSNKLIKIGDKE